MLFKRELWAGLADGTVTLTFRRWRRPQARPGGRYRTPVGVLAVDAVDLVDPTDIGEQDARRAGFPSRTALLAELDRHGDGPAYRVAFHFAGPDPREALRRADRLGDDEWARLQARLARLDRASPHGAWTLAVLRLIAERPGVRAGDLAAAIGRERASFKLDVRKLKELGLTESLEVGYRLSPRGRALLDRAGGADAAGPARLPPPPGPATLAPAPPAGERGGMADAPGLGPGGATRGGSSPPARTPPLTCPFAILTSRPVGGR